MPRLLDFALFRLQRQRLFGKEIAIRQAQCRAGEYTAACRCSMGVLALRFAHVFCSVFIIMFVVVVTCFAQAQQISPAIRSASQLPNAPSAVSRVPGSQTNLSVFTTGSPSHLIPDAGQSACWMDTCGNRIQNTLALNDHVTQYTNSRIARALLTFAPMFSRVQPKTFHSADDWQYYGHHLPLAGPVVLRVGKEAQAHPHIVTVIKLIHPEF